MPLPTYPEPFSRPAMSEWYSFQNIQFTTDVNKNLQFYFAIKNLFNYVQSSPLVNPSQPFSDTFDTSYIYGPLQTRRLLFGVRIQFDKKAF